MARDLQGEWQAGDELRSYSYSCTHFSFVAVRAVLAERGDDPALAWRTAQDLQGEWQAGGEGSSGGRLASVLAAFSRPTRIVRGKQVEASWTVDPALFDCNEERALHTAFVGVASAVDARSTSVGDFLAACVPLIAPIDAYFEKVFVMSEDEKVRRNRLAMLRDLAALPRGVIDLSQLPGF